HLEGRARHRRLADEVEGADRRVVPVHVVMMGAVVRVMIVVMMVAMVVIRLLGAEPRPHILALARPPAVEAEQAAEQALGRHVGP
ncbi:hypothetical protein, partial [Escherichia coli]|uniref:hypothetical protein n=1 Tax=Escherichia coli TaxID=562 RepID=UPI001556F86C